MRQLFGALTLVILTALLAGHALATSVSLIGVIRSASGGAVSGANVYVRRILDTSGSRTTDDEVGPVTTSSTGAFSFYSLPAGVYVLRIGIAGVDVWRGEVTAPGEIPPIILH